MAEIIDLQSKAARERRRRLRNLKRAAELLRAKLETEQMRSAVDATMEAVEGLYDGELSKQDADTMLAAAGVILRAVRLDIDARLVAPKLAAIEAEDKISPF
jgi:hypothetical protein